MIRVSNQSQLAAALRGQEPSIQITADFPLASQINILYEVTIESLSPNSPRTLFKDPGYDGFLFRIFGGGALHLTNITLDGRSEEHDPNSALARSLICVADGSLCLDTQSVLKNNSSSSDGGGVLICGGSGCTNRFEMIGNARITGCSAQVNGGGIAASGQSRITFLSGSIRGNHASHYGGGVWLRDRSVFAMSGGSVLDNHAFYGGGFYNDAGAGLLLTGGTVSRNSAEAGGGIYNSEQSCATLSSAGDLGGEGDNDAALYAPGIYNSGDLRAENMREITNGVYLSSRSSVVRIVGPLAPGSQIQIDGSGYVSPNDAGIPIVIAESALPCGQLTETDRKSFLKPPSGFDGWDIQLSGDMTQVLLVSPGYGGREAEKSRVS
ncbi:MAG: hypothetical protein LUG90_12960 [Clostridiaceae bacterium]|nr:hypothetical protein [Clostridiaceae bacterium]